MTAHARRSPTEIPTAVAPSDTVCTDWEGVVDPLPSSPAPLLPQQRTEPVSSRAHELVEPAAMSIALSPVSSATSTGLEDGSVVPSPSSPWEFAPQHHTRPSDSTAHECCAPVDTFTARFAQTTFTGAVESTTVPSPS